MDSMKRLATFLGTNSDPDFLQFVYDTCTIEGVKREKILPFMISSTEKVLWVTGEQTSQKLAKFRPSSHRQHQRYAAKVPLQCPCSTTAVEFTGSPFRHQRNATNSMAICTQHLAMHPCLKYSTLL
nr:uncharacterized protein LOC117683520 [Crassostrea gigas]